MIPQPHTLPSVNMMRAFGLEPDPWQLRVLEARPRRLLNCSRQAGKSTTAAMLALGEAVLFPRTLVLLLSRSLRQSAELFRGVSDFFFKKRSPMVRRKCGHELQLSNDSRIVSLPCSGDTIRGFANVKVLIIDEAARVPDDLYRTVRPMLAVSGGRLLCLSTPYGKRGFFHDAWAHGGPEWMRVEVPASQVPRIAPEFLEEERRNLGESWYRQEYCCSFEAREGLVYPDFAKHVTPDMALWHGLPTVPRAPTEGLHDSPTDSGRPSVEAGGTVGRPCHNNVPTGRLVGGIDFGFRNPFAAVWGVVDRDDVLWLTGEHYERSRPLSHHAGRLPRAVRWYADPSGAGEISELRRAGFSVSAGKNALRQGIAAVTARLHGRLKVLPGACPNLLAEAELYRYSDDATDKRAETPVDENNHALAALRYLVMKLDAGRHVRTAPVQTPEDRARLREEQERQKQREWLSVWNEALWRRCV
jgi:hypothetical protein